MTPPREIFDGTACESGDAPAWRYDDEQVPLCRECWFASVVLDDDGTDETLVSVPMVTVDTRGRT